MINNNIFYNEHTRNAIVAFGALFSNIKVARRDKNNLGEIIQTIAVPIEYSNKEKWLLRIDQDPTNENQTYNILPRLAYEIVGINYDPTRKINKFAKINCRTPDGTSAQSTYAPSPWDIEITLYAMTKTQEDGYQIVEQILPYFSPELTISIQNGVGLGIIDDIPLILNSVSMEDDYEGDFQTRRSVIWTLNFTMKLNLFGPVSNGGLIKKVTINLPSQNATYTATQATPVAPIIETMIYK